MTFRWILSCVVPCATHHVSTDTSPIDDNTMPISHTDISGPVLIDSTTIITFLRRLYRLQMEVDDSTRLRLQNGESFDSLIQVRLKMAIRALRFTQEGVYLRTMIAHHVAWSIAAGLRGRPWFISLNVMVVAFWRELEIFIKYKHQSLCRCVCQ